MCFNQIYASALVTTCGLLLCVDVGAAQHNVSMKDNTHTLGKVDFLISCGSEAQSRFERGLSFLHHMMYVQAEKEFTALANMEPSCAMAHWGYRYDTFPSLVAGTTE